MSNRVFFLPSSSLEVAQRLFVEVKNAKAEAKDCQNAGGFQRSFELSLSFNLMLCNPFTVGNKDDKVCSLTAFKDAGHALHCAMLHGFPRERLALIKVELAEDAYEKLVNDQQLKVLSEHSFGVYVYALLVLEEPSVRFSVVSQSDPEIVTAVENFNRRF